MSEKEARIRLTEPRTLQVRRSGTSDVLTLPADWMRTVPDLKSQNGNLAFECYIEKALDGEVFLIGKKERKKP